MEFIDNKPIYMQMADRLMDDIVAGVYSAEDRVPSVREYAMTLGVHTNTAVKAYDELSRMNIIYNKRGLGYFVHPDAKRHIVERRKHEFLNIRLRQLHHEMTLLNLSVEEVAQMLRTINTVTES